MHQAQDVIICAVFLRCHKAFPHYSVLETAYFQGISKEMILFKMTLMKISLIVSVLLIDLEPSSITALREGQKLWHWFTQTLDVHVDPVQGIWNGSRFPFHVLQLEHMCVITECVNNQYPTDSKTPKHKGSSLRISILFNLVFYFILQNHYFLRKW